MASPLPAERALPRPHWWRAAILFALTLLTTTSFGTGFYLFTRTDVVIPRQMLFDPALLLFGYPGEFFASLVRIPLMVLGTPSLLRIGLMYSLPLMLILLAHELGHYLACRRHRIPSTPPYFLPAPFLIGTFGAFIRIRGAIRNRRELLDVGAAGPIAGFVALLPFLIIGIARSRWSPIVEVEFEVGVGELLVPGQSALSRLLIAVFHPVPEPGMVLDLHPFALAAWVGLLVTALNLMPAGQLDGGHILYALSPRWHRWLRPVVVVALAALGFVWPGWWIWCAIVLLIARRHPPLVNPYEPLDAGRKKIAAAALAILIAVFMLVPISFKYVLL